MVTIIVILLYCFVIGLDYVPLLKKRGKKENIICGVLLVTSFCVIFLYSIGIQLPGPSEPIKAAVEKLFMNSK